MVGEAGVRGRRCQHGPDGERRIGGDLVPHGNPFVVEAPSAEVGHHSDAAVAGFVGKVPQRRGATHCGAELIAHALGEAHGRWFLELAVWFAVWSKRHARGRCVFGDVVDLEHVGVDRRQVAAGMIQIDRSGSAGPIEMVAVESFAVEVQRVDTPGDEHVGFSRARGSHLGIDLGDPSDDLIDILAALPQPAIGCPAVKEPDVGVLPHTTRHCVAMALHETGHDDLVREHVVHGVFTPRS